MMNPEGTMKSPSMPRSENEPTPPRPPDAKEGRERPAERECNHRRSSITGLFEHEGRSEPHREPMSGIGHRIRLRLDELDAYHGSAAFVMAAGSIGMIVSMLLGLGPMWAGFLAVALPIFLLIGLIHPEHA